MVMTLGTALRLRPRAAAVARSDTGLGVSLAFTGAGGKTTTIFSLARELPVPSLITTTTHIGTWQTEHADRHIVASRIGDLKALGDRKVNVITGPEGDNQRLSAVSATLLNQLRTISLSRGWPLLIEADGARQRPLKAPRADEPQVPLFVEGVVVVAGMEGLGRPLDDQSVHRPDIFAGLSGVPLGSSISADAVAKVLVDAKGGLKGVPERARRIALLNQADTIELQAAALRIAHGLAQSYDAVLLASARAGIVHAALETVAGIVLAAGGATRYGSPKQLLAWKGQPLVRTAVQAALDAGLSSVVVVTGAHAVEVEAAVGDMRVTVARNKAWVEGQASSIRRGLEVCPPGTASAVFLLADQPFVAPALIRALVEAHASEAAAIVAPLIGGDRRGNPVLFDRETFEDLRGLRREEGGRAIFSGHRVHYVPWHDEKIIQDIDTQQDYDKLLEGEQE
jgi:molybdenum cofactor cytidylyltransferase